MIANALIQDPVFQLYVGAVLALSLNLLVLANNTALTRAKADEVVNPEDRKLNAKASVVLESGNQVTERYRRAHRNALENIPLFLVTGLLVPIVGVSAEAAAGLFATFVAARFAHSFCYVKQIQPYRTMMFVVGALTQLAMLGFIGYHTFVG